VVLEGRQLELREMRLPKNILNVVAVIALLPVYLVIGLWLLLMERKEHRRRLDQAAR
jgi:hypothetical protein